MHTTPFPAIASVDSTILAAITLAANPVEGTSVSQEHLARVIEFHRLNNPKFYDAVKATLKFDEVKPLSCKLSSDDVYSLLVFIIVLLPMAFEYFFPAQSEIPGMAALPFSIDSVALNTSLTALLLYAKIKALMFNSVTLIDRVRQTSSGTEALQVIGASVDRTILPGAWSSTGRRVLREAYHNAPVQYLWEMFKPLPSLFFKFIGVIAALCYAAILFQNSENAYFKALTMHAWLRLIFSPADYNRGFATLNAATLPLNAPLYSQDYGDIIGDVVDTDIKTLAIRGKVPSSFERMRNFGLSFISAGGETPTLLAKMHYILSFMGPAQQKAMKSALSVALQKTAELIPSDAEEVDLTDLVEIEDQLNKESAMLIRPVDRQAVFKVAGLACLALSLVTTGYYCSGIVPLFTQASANPNLWQFIRTILLFLKADTAEGAYALSFLSVGVFSVIHSTDGFRMVRDYSVKVYEAEGIKAKTDAVAEGLITGALSALSALTAAVEAGSSGSLISKICGGAKGASINAKGARLPARMLVNAGGRILDGVGSVYNASTGLSGVCCPRRARRPVSKDESTLELLEERSP